MKSPEMEKALDDLAKEAFGRSRQDPACVTCGSKEVQDEDFSDELSRREFRISRMCQACQDSVFGLDD